MSRKPTTAKIIRRFVNRHQEFIASWRNKSTIRRLIEEGHTTKSKYKIDYCKKCDRNTYHHRVGRIPYTWICNECESETND